MDYGCNEESIVAKLITRLVTGRCPHHLHTHYFVNYLPGEAELFVNHWAAVIQMAQ